jgi:hypothetical protein
MLNSSLKTLDELRLLERQIIIYETIKVVTIVIALLLLAFISYH